MLLDPVGVLTQGGDSSGGTIFGKVAKLIQQRSDEDQDILESGDVGGDPEEPDHDANEPEEGDKAKTGARRAKCRRSAKPLNEFTNKFTFFYGAFWHLFPLRIGLWGDGPVPPVARRRLVTQFHDAFAQDPQFLFLLADQVQRHAAARGVALRVRANPESFETFGAMVADRDTFLERLEAAKNDPLSKES